MKRVSVCLLVCFLVACQTNPQRAVAVEEDQVNVAIEFVTAYNQHDIAAMISLVHEDIKYMFISGNQIHTVTNGKAHLKRYLKPFFEHNPKASSRIRSSKLSGDFIQLLEEAVFTDKQGQERSQCSFSMYQLKDNLIINVWYFDAHKCGERY